MQRMAGMAGNLNTFVNWTPHQCAAHCRLLSKAGYLWPRVSTLVLSGLSPLQAPLQVKQVAKALSNGTFPRVLALEIKLVSIHAHRTVRSISCTILICCPIAHDTQIYIGELIILFILSTQPQLVSDLSPLALCTVLRSSFEERGRPIEGFVQCPDPDLPTCSSLDPFNSVVNIITHLDMRKLWVRPTSLLPLGDHDHANYNKTSVHAFSCLYSLIL